MDMADPLAVNFAYHADDPSAGFAINADYSRIKMFLADTGLFVTLAFMNHGLYRQRYIQETTFRQALLQSRLCLRKHGAVQTIRSGSNKLFYFTFKEAPTEDASARKRTYEIEFLLSCRDKIFPIEVKASGYNSHKSLDNFCRRFSSRTSDSYILYTKGSSGCRRYYSPSNLYGRNTVVEQVQVRFNGSAKIFSLLRTGAGNATFRRVSIGSLSVGRARRARCLR